MFQNLFCVHKNSWAVPTDIKAPLVMSPAWLPVRCGRQGQSIVVNQASNRGNSGWKQQYKHSEMKSVRKWKHYPAGKWISAVLRRHILVETDTLSRARTPVTSSTGLEMTGTAGLGVLVAEVWIGKVFEVQVDQQNHLSETYRWPACEYHCVCECPTEWSGDEIKDLFFDQLGAVTARIPGFEFLIPWGDWNGHVCRAGTGYREAHGGMGPPIQITSDMVRKAFFRWKQAKHWAQQA